MNCLGLLAGDVVGTIGTKIAKEFIKTVAPAIKSGGKEFFDIFQKNVNEKKLDLDDLELNPEERSSILEMRNIAMQNGVNKVEIEVHGNKFKMNTQDLSLTPVVA